MKLGEIEIIDNFLEQENFFMIEQILGDNTPWKYSGVISGYKDSKLMCDELYNYQYTHVVYIDDRIFSEFFNVLEESNLFFKLGVRSICRIKFNSIPKAEKIITHGFHQDIYFDDESLTEDGVKSAILYINSNDGFTVFEDGTKVESVANRLVKFPSTLKHSGTTCTDCHRRVALNIVYF